MGRKIETGTGSDRTVTEGLGRDKKREEERQSQTVQEKNPC